MQLLTRSDIKGPRLYAGMRDDFRRHVIAYKQRERRVVLGERLSLVFENRTTLIFQIEEILRAEGIDEADRVQAEIDVYNQLMPGDDSLSATLFVELPPAADARIELGRLVGLDEHLVLAIGPHTTRAAFEPGRAEADRISAVQYVRFPVAPAARAALATPGTAVALAIDHPAYQVRVDLAEPIRASLAKDLGA